MTCKDCIHKTVCYALIKGGLPYIDEKTPAEKFCITFKNENDITEVKHGHKGLHVGHKYYCSVCGQLAYCEEFCSRCGAMLDLKGGIDNANDT